MRRHETDLTLAQIIEFCDEAIEFVSSESLETLERVAQVLNAKVRITFEAAKAGVRVQESESKYSARKKAVKKSSHHSRP